MRTAAGKEPDGFHENGTMALVFRWPVSPGSYAAPT